MFHLIPWTDVPADFDALSKYPSTWVTFSNRFYDPRKGPSALQCLFSISSSTRNFITDQVPLAFFNCDRRLCLVKT